MTDNKTHPFAVFMAWASIEHTLEDVSQWLDGTIKNDTLAKYYNLFSQGKTQDIISALAKTALQPPTPTQPTPEPVTAPTTTPKAPITPVTQPTQPKPESMQIIDNIQPADQDHKEDWFPYKGIMTITTSDPQNTQFITAEIRDEHNQLVEVAQIDPEFDREHQVIHLKIQTSFEDLEGQTLKRIVAWSDASSEEYSETSNFICV